MFHCISKSKTDGSASHVARMYGVDVGDHRYDAVLNFDDGTFLQAVVRHYIAHALLLSTSQLKTQKQRDVAAAKSERRKARGEGAAGGAGSSSDESDSDSDTDTRAAAKPPAELLRTLNI